MPVIPLPSGPFAVVVADPPWQYQKAPRAQTRAGHPETGGRGGVAEWSYPTMSNEDIAALPVKSIAAADAHLFLWFTNPKMFGGAFSDLTPADIATAWGFEYQTTITWVKTTAAGVPTRNGMGWYFRGCTEHVLYAARGKASIPASLREPNVILAPRGRHSEKPAAFMELVERVTPGPRLEMFARSIRRGWSAWGNEVDSNLQIGGVA